MLNDVKVLLTVLLSALALTAAASADERPLPWAGGQEVVSELEARLASIAGEFTNKTVSIYCQGNNDWANLAAQGGFNPATVWGYVEYAWNPGTYTYGPRPYAHFSEQACLYLDRLLAAVDKRSQKNCQSGTQPIYEDQPRDYIVWKTKTVKKRVRTYHPLTGKPVWRTKLVKVRVRTTVTRLVSVKIDEVPVYSTCTDWNSKLWAYQTLSHETMHLLGAKPEYLAECWGMQSLSWFMIRMGVDTEFAKEIATDVWSDIYLKRPVGSYYVSSDCRDGGTLDLVPGNTSWPNGY